MFHIVLVEPEIPQNTGSIARTCAATGSMLHLVGKLGFSIEQKEVRRAGLDYWDKVFVDQYPDLDGLLARYPNARLWLATTKAKQFHTAAKFSDGDFLVFGKETKGLDQSILERYPQQMIRLPMRKDLRSLNLANSVAAILYEALRQTGFPGLV